MRLRSDGVTDLDADFDIAGPDANGQYRITIESAGGSRATGVRNPDYPKLLEEILRRAAALGANITDAIVDSRQTKTLDDDQRRINVDGRPYPIRLSLNEDLHDLRKGLTRPQGDIASARQTGGGNQRKRMTMTLRFDQPTTRDELIDRLHVATAADRSYRTGISDGLTRADVDHAIGRWHCLGREAFLAQLSTPQTGRYSVPDGKGPEIDATALLLDARRFAGLDVAGPWRQHRADIVIALRNLGIPVTDSDRPEEAPLGDDPAAYRDLASRLGGTDQAVQRLGRREQRFLRGSLGIALGGTAAVAACGLCGSVVPVELLVAAHIKPRHACTDEERVDMPYVGWALCLLGCDALFERGFLSVDDDGTVISPRQGPDAAPGLRETVASMVGTTAVGWSPERRRYFAVHRELHTSQ